MLLTKKSSTSRLSVNTPAENTVESNKKSSQPVKAQTRFIKRENCWLGDNADSVQTVKIDQLTEVSNKNSPIKNNNFNKGNRAKNNGLHKITNKTKYSEHRLKTEAQAGNTVCGGLKPEIKDKKNTITESVYTEIASNKIKKEEPVTNSRQINKVNAQYSGKEKFKDAQPEKKSGRETTHKATRASENILHKNKPVTNAVKYIEQTLATDFTRAETNEVSHIGKSIKPERSVIKGKNLVEPIVDTRKSETTSPEQKALSSNIIENSDVSVPESSEKTNQLENEPVSESIPDSIAKIESATAEQSKEDSHPEPDIAQNNTAISRSIRPNSTPISNIKPVTVMKEPEVKIGQIDVFIESSEHTESKNMTATSQPAYSHSSRYYLRRL